MDEEIKKCTKTCVDKVRKNKGKNNTHSYHENVENENDPKTQKNEEATVEHKTENIKVTEKNEQGNQEKNCFYKDEKYSEFCEANVDPNSKDYRKKNGPTCIKYFCPLCCEQQSLGVI